MTEYTYKYEDKCWFTESCPRKKSKGCSATCIIRREFDYLLWASQVPEKYRGYEKTVLMPTGKDFKVFTTLNDIKQDIVNFVNEGRFLYIWGYNTASGKTTWGIKLLLTYLANRCIGNGFNPSVAYFVYVPSFLFSAKNFDNKEERQEVLKKVMEVDLLVLDDISATQMSKYDDSVLADLIDHRYRNSKSTIFTSNVSPDDLENTCGVRTADRILSDIAVEITGAGHRSFSNEYRRKPVNN